MTVEKRSGIRIIAISLITGLMPQIVMGTPRPFYQQYKMIQEIAMEASTPGKKSKVVAELMGIVQEEKDVHLRQFAAEKLGELEAVEAKDMLKALAETLEWGDSTRRIKWTAFLAYWQIKVAEQSSKEEQIQLLVQALHEKFDGLIASNVQMWAANELANRGVEKALPEIIKSIRYRNPTERGEEQIRLCTTKIKLLTTTASRQEALTEALVIEDSTQYQRLKRWAIKELEKLNTQESRYILIGYALELQSRCYDNNGKWIVSKGDRMGAYAGEFYRTIIKILKKADMTNAEIKATTLQPDKLFITAP